MSDSTYTVGKIGFGPAWSDKLNDERDDAGICIECGNNMTPVRPGKAQCHYCELDESLQHAEKRIEELEAAVMSLYPDWVCRDCGRIHGKRVYRDHIATFHVGVCHLCHKSNVEVSEPRDFGHLHWPLKKRKT